MRRNETVFCYHFVWSWEGGGEGGGVMVQWCVAECVQRRLLAESNWKLKNY
jgi:hypothetical protein